MTEQEILYSPEDAARLIEARKFHDEWVYWADEVRRWFVVTQDDMKYLGELMSDRTVNWLDVYSLWCSETHPRVMYRAQVQISSSIIEEFYIAAHDREDAERVALNRTPRLSEPAEVLDLVLLRDDESLDLNNPVSIETLKASSYLAIT